LKREQAILNCFQKVRISMQKCHKVMLQVVLLSARQNEGVQLVQNAEFVIADAS
jgi:hypothetical protein